MIWMNIQMSSDVLDDLQNKQPVASSHPWRSELGRLGFRQVLVD